MRTAPDHLNPDAPPAAWICDSCIEAGWHLSVRTMRRHFVPLPTGPDATCAECGDPLPDVLRVRLLLEHATRPSARGAPATLAVRALSLNAAARRLGRSKTTIRRLQHEGAIRAVPWPGKKAKDAFPLSEIERIEREGVVVRPPPPPPKRTGKPKGATAASRSERTAAVARILAVKDR